MNDAMPAEMTAIEISKPGAPDVLRAVRRPVPRPAEGEVLIRVAAAGVNRPDVFQRLGHYAPPPGASDLPGLEVAGTVVAAGPAAGSLAVGDRVCALVSGGGYAEYCAVPAPQCLPVPKGLDMVAAAAIPETFFTVWTNLFDGGRLVAGETLLVHGGSSGIGTTAIQIGIAFGARVIATVGSADKAAACEALGAAAIDYRQEDFVAGVRRLTGGEGVDVILDMVGGDYTAKNLELLRMDGRLVQIAHLRGSKTEIELSQVMRRRLTLTGSLLRPRSVAQKGAIASALRQHVWPLLEAGRVRPQVHATFPLADAAAAHRLMESSAHIGKIVLTV
jgi:NADPH:quinone reductase